MRIKKRWLWKGLLFNACEKDGGLVSEFQSMENDLAEPEAFVASLKELIEYVEKEEP